MPSELLAIFGESHDLSAFSAKLIPSPSAADAALEENLLPLANCELSRLVHEVAGAARAQSFAVQDVARQLNQIAGLIVQNPGDVQGSWAATQNLRKRPANWKVWSNTSNKLGIRRKNHALDQPQKCDKTV